MRHVRSDGQELAGDDDADTAGCSSRAMIAAPKKRFQCAGDGGTASSAMTRFVPSRVSPGADGDAALPRQRLRRSAQLLLRQVQKIEGTIFVTVN
jgi:hypothetical protein